MSAIHPALHATARPLRTAILRSLTLPCLLAAAAPAAAQEGFPRLTDADVQRVIPLLRAQVEEGRWLTTKARGISAAANEVERASEHAAAGGIDDPLAWLRERLPGGVPVPPEVKYHLACSRAMTRADRQPTAVFTFGVAAMGHDRAVLEGRGDAYMVQQIEASGALDLIRAAQGALGGKSGLNLDSLQASAATAATDRTPPEERRRQKYIDDTRAFYRERRFETRSALAPLHFDAPDGRMYGWLNTAIDRDKLPGCESMPTGPYILVRYAAPATPRSDDPSPLTAALARAGMSSDEFQGLYSALLMASVDVNDPHHATPLMLPDATPEAKRAAVAYAALRKNNVEVYRRHSGTLTTLIAELRTMR